MMNEKYPKLVERLQARFGDILASCVLSDHNEVTIEIDKQDLITVCTALRDEAGFAFEQLMDLCAVDYIAYGDVEWQTEAATETGFSRGRTEGNNNQRTWQGPRFAVVYHLISYSLNQRLRVRSFVDESMPVIDSVTSVWNCADWFEREAFDLMGIIFEGHPDLRRILTDYGFIGHPFRKDFPLIGQVEMRYDAELQRVVYEPVNIEPRVLVPRVIRDDERYAGGG